MIGLSNPYVLLGASVGALLAISGAFVAGWSVRGWKADADQLKAVTAEQKKTIEVQGRLDVTAARLSDKENASYRDERIGRDTIREIYRNIPAPPASCEPPPAARQLLIDAGATGDAAAVGERQREGGVPGAGPPAGEVR